MSKFIQKEKYNVSARAINLHDIDRLNEYQRSLFDFMIYTPKLTASQIKSIKLEINNIEYFIENYFKSNLFNLPN